MTRLVALLALLACTGAAAAASGPDVSVNTVALATMSLEDEPMRVPHHLGLLTNQLAERSAGLPVPSLLFTGDDIVLSEKDNPQALVIPNVLNAGATRMDDTYLYPLAFGELSADLDNNAAAFSQLAAHSGKSAGLAEAPRIAFDPAQVPDLRLGLDLAEGSVNACAVNCAPSDASAMLARVLGHAAFARADGFAGAAPLTFVEDALPGAPNLAFAAPQASPYAPEAARPSPLASLSGGPAPAVPDNTAAALLAASVLLGLALAPLALYSKIRRDATLDNDTRRTVFESVVASPGLSIQEVARRATISHSTAAYHLDRLSSAGLVVATGDGNKVRFYRNGGRFTEQERKLLPCLENAETVAVLENVLHHPWTYRAEVASALGVTATTVNWHLKRLFGASVLSEVREGRSAYLFVDRAALAGACAGLEEKTPDSAARSAARRILAQLGQAPGAMPAVALPEPARAAPSPVAAMAMPVQVTMASPARAPGGFGPTLS